jgi:ornithine cyclodeaminase
MSIDRALPGGSWNNRRLLNKSIKKCWRMKIITDDDIKALKIPATRCIEWVEESFKMKSQSQLPPKISLHPQEDDFFNTMPCILPKEYHTFSVKIVNRIKGNHPALKSKLSLFDTITGSMLALMDANWITNMRTGAVAALAIKTFKKRNARVFALMGLGEIAHSTMQCIIASCKHEELYIKLLKYKDQAESFAYTYQKVSNLHFTIVNTMDDFIKGSDVVISCITSADGILEPKNNLFKPGVLVLPIHTRGFQNCDLFFDKVFADDRGHVKDFKYFDRFKYFDEIGNVLLCKSKGRENDTERILSYNIGLGLHDAVFAYKIYNMIENVE